MIQSRDLVMIALGSQGQSKRWFGPPLEDGVHLRWAFLPELGFPSRGFALSRRAHVAGTPIPLPELSATPVVKLPVIARRVTAEFTNLRWLPFMNPPQPLPTMTGLFGDVPVAVSSHPAINRPRLTLALESDAVDAVRIDAAGRWRLKKLQYEPITPDAQTWTALQSICLPITDPDYPCHAGPVNPAVDWEEAKARVGQDPGVLAEYLSASDWSEIHERLRSLFNPPIPRYLNIPSTVEGEPPGLGISTVDLMLLASIDPYFARVLGLYWLDRAAIPNHAYDYKLVGTWLKSQLKAPEVTLDFEADRFGRRYADTFLREGVILRSFNQGVVENAADAPWTDTRRALDLRPFTDPGVLNRPAYLRIQFQEPVTEAQLYLHVEKGDPRLRASITNVTVGRWSSQDGRFTILTIGATNENERIEFVTLDPAAGSSELHVSLCKVGLLRNWSAPLSEERIWITYNVTASTPPPLTAPTGLIVNALTTPARELPDGHVASGPLAAMRWNLPIAGQALLPRESVRYVIERQRLGSGSAPNAINAESWEAVNVDAPVAISSDEDAPQHLFYDDPAAATAPPAADRYYAYRVAGIDLFGRLSAYSAPAVGDLTDRQAPSPPLNVEAEIVDGAVKVRWEWSPNRRDQAPDAREFRVYGQRGRLNTLAGHVTNVTANADGTFTVTTDQTLASSAIDAFAGESLLNQRIYFAVLGNTAGVNFEITLKAPSAPPPVRPDTGPFSVAIRAPVPLEGLIVRARHHLGGTVTLKTDQSSAVPANGLAGKWLRQGGGDFRIVENTTGKNLRITVRGPGLPARSPGKGKFAVLDSDRVTPVLSDPGNPLYVDYKQPRNWPERLHVEPVAPSIVGPYEVTLPFDVGAVAGEAVAYAQVAVSTADDKEYVADDPHWNGTPLGYRSGNEGTVSSPVLLQKPLRQMIQRPDAPDVGDGMATAADYYGHSLIDVRWQQEDGKRVDVYRALDEAIFAADRSARAIRSTERDEYSWLSDEAFGALIAQQPDYTNLSDGLFQSLASLNDAPFGLTTSVPLETDSYKATIDGRSANRYCFAIKRVDVAGNRSALSWPSGAVRPRKSAVLTVPFITRIVGGERQITLQWMAIRDHDVHEYRIYRTDKEESARDVRLMNLIHTEPADSQQLSFTDEPVPGLVPFIYRLVAATASGATSESSQAASAMAFDEAPPVPPIPTASWTQTDAGQRRASVAWSAPDETLLQRRVLELGEWQPMTGWMAAGAHSFTDEEAEASRSYEYRAWARKSTGAIAIGAPVLLSQTI